MLLPTKWLFFGYTVHDFNKLYIYVYNLKKEKNFNVCCCYNDDDDDDDDGYAIREIFNH